MVVLPSLPLLPLSWPGRHKIQIFSCALTCGTLEKVLPALKLESGAGAIEPATTSCTSESQNSNRFLSASRLLSASRSLHSGGQEVGASVFLIRFWEPLGEAILSLFLAFAMYARALTLILKVAV